MKKLIVAIMSLTVIFSFSVIAFTQEIKHLDQLKEEFGSEFLLNHDVSLTNAMDILNSFPQSRTGEIIYPDYFGGLYIDDNGNLVNLVVTETNFDNHVRRLSENITIREVEFSYRELREIWEYITERIISRGDMIFYNTGGQFLDVSGNRIVVELIDYSENGIELFRELMIDSPVIQFIEFIETDWTYGLGINFDTENIEYESSEEHINNAVIGSETIDILPANNITVTPGDPIRVYRNGQWVGTGSIGYRAIATFDSRRGFVTAAHIANGGLQRGDIVHAQGRRIGILAGNDDARLSGVDAAGIQIDSNVSVAGQFSNISLTPTVIQPIQGGMVSSRGTPGGTSNPIIRSGTITNTSRNVTVNGVSLTRVVETNFSTLGGESGGIIISPIPGAAATLRGVQGIIVAGSANTTLFSHANNIRLAIGSWVTH
ncbi:MAG: S1 family peptidase [Defluviitaleaceae bacterium]|nr:S1 family peptidase [Defluviitaleaceae bacterium]